MNQHTNMAATAAVDLVQQIATTLLGDAGAGVTDLITLANLVQGDMGNPISASLSTDPVARRKLAELQADGFIVNGAAIFNPRTGKRGVVDYLGYVGWIEQSMDQGQQVVRYRIEDAPGVDPITVYVENYAPGQGRLLVTCYGNAWTAYWGAMGNTVTTEAFVAGCDPHYVADNLVWGIDAKKHQRAYADKVAAAVVGFFKSRRAVQALGNA